MDRNSSPEGHPIHAGPLQPPGYPVIRNIELPPLISKDEHDQPNDHFLPMHAPGYSRQGPILPHRNFHQPPKGAPFVQSPEYRARMGYPPLDQINRAEHAKDVGPLPHVSHSATTVAQITNATPPVWYGQGPCREGASGGHRQKAHRATQACGQCRAKKAKCDERRPTCSHCKENNLSCVYKEVPPHKQEKTTQLVLNRLSELDRKMEEQADHFYKRFAECQGQMHERIQMLNRPGEQPHHVAQKSLSYKKEFPQTQTFAPNVLDPRSQNVLELNGSSLDHQDTEGELSIPVDHTTAAHKLLMWPSIKRLLHPATYDEDYVMRLEDRRRLIGIYGQGEISYTADDRQSLMDTDFKGARPQGHVAGPHAYVNIDEFGNLNLDATTARRYYDSYFEHMFTLHPFVEEAELNRKFDSFIRCYCGPDTSPSSTSNYTRLSRDGPPPAKRRQSDENLDESGEFMETIPSQLRPRVGKNIDNALVLLCLAIGAICEAPAPLPGPITDKDLNYLNQHIPAPLSPFTTQPTVYGTHVVNGIISTTRSGSEATLSLSTSLGSLSSQPLNQSLPKKPFNDGFVDSSRRDTTKAWDEQGNTCNDKAIPGLALYGYATTILGHLQGGNDLEHVQCGLLAGLYAGQLAHPFQSHSWIFQASRACQILVRTKRYEKLNEGATKDLCNFAYWTCLQLESDLLAELDIPASGISRSESRMPIPKGKWTIDLPNDVTAPNTKMMLFYSAQIYLRKFLNRVHTHLYKAEKQGKALWSHTVQQALSRNLDVWRENLPIFMQWDEGDPPANEINAARMRAKYYGARYIIHRPLLYDALHRQPPEVRLHELPEQLRAACDICIRSAIKSTEAFDGVAGHRLVVTNIFGTAHAQFGNMLVLSATFMSSLKELVEREQLKVLLVRTIGFLVQSENISPTLRADARILTGIYEKVFEESPDLRQNTRKS